MKNRLPKKLICVLVLSLSLCLSLICPACTHTARAALKLSCKKVTMQAGHVEVVDIKKCSFPKITATSSDVRVLAVAANSSVIRLIAIKKGNVTVTVNGYNKKGKLKKQIELPVKVKKAPEVDLATEYAPDNIHSGEATFYDLGDTTGSANLDDFGTTFLTAALNTEDYMNGLAGAFLEVTDKDGDVINVLVTDLLPAGKKGDIDLTREAFKTIEPLGTGRMAITWRVIALPTDKPVRFLWKPSSSKYWASVQVRNNTYPVKTLEYLDKNGEYVPLYKESYNYFTAKDGLDSEGPFTFRLTDIYGQQIVETDIPLQKNSEEVEGSGNFPVLTSGSPWFSACGVPDGSTLSQ